MQSPTNSRNGAATLIVVLIILFTFPVWIGLAGGIFGLIAGLFGIVASIIGGVFSLVGSIIGGVFSAIFGWPHWNWDVDCEPGWRFFHPNAFTTLVAIIAIVLLARSRRK